MIVNKPIGSVKIGNTNSRLTVGKLVPKVVLDYWKKTGQLEGLKKAGAISDSESSDNSNVNVMDEKKKEKPVEKKEEKSEMFKDR